jgi:hypothetical protein
LYFFLSPVLQLAGSTQHQRRGRVHLRLL